MFVKSAIDMSRSNMLYAAGVGVLMMISLAISNVPAFALSQFVDFPYRKEICATLFLTGALLGAVAINQHLQRSKFPWKTPQSQITIFYTGFFITTLLAIVLAK